MAMVRMTVIILLGLLLVVPGQAQKKKKTRELKLGAGKVFKCEDLPVEFKVPVKSIQTIKKRLQKNMKAQFGFSKFNYEICLETTRASALEQFRESVIRQMQDKHPSVQPQIRRGLEFGGMKGMTITLPGFRRRKGADYLIINAVDVPAQGIVILLISGPRLEKDQLTRLNSWLMPTFRMSGEEGDDLLFESRVVHVQSGLSYRVPRGSMNRGTPTQDHIFEGHAPGGIFVRVDRQQTTEDSDLKNLLKDWASGAKAIGKSRKVTTRSSGGEAICALFDKYGGKPVRALCAFKPNDTTTFRIEIAGSEMPLLHLERMMSVLEWLDIPTLEEETAGWKKKVEEAVKAGDERTLKKYGRRIADRYYLTASLELARIILKSGPERAQRYALACLEKGGSPGVDFIHIRKAMSNSKYRTRVKMRVKAAEAMGALVNLKCSNYLLQLIRDKETKVAKAAILALGNHKANRKKTIPVLIRQFDQVTKEGKSRSAKKKLRLSRLGDAFRTALRELTGQDFKSPKAARTWLTANRKILNKEELKK